MIALIMFMAISATYPVATESDTSVIDIDGNVYKTVRIGHQLWMAENLRTTRYADGSAIANIQDPDVLNSTTTGVWLNYDNETANDSVYGKLYNFNAVGSTAGLCPENWHVPTIDEMNQLIEYLGGASVAGGKMKSTGNLAAGSGLWREPNGGATNQSGFSANPGGYYSASLKKYDSINLNAHFWTSSPTGSTQYGNPTYHAITVGYAYANTSGVIKYKTDANSVRCVRDVTQAAVIDEALLVRGSTHALITGFVSLDEEATIHETGVVWTMAPFAGASVNGPTLENYHGKHLTNSTDRGVNEVYLTSLSPASSFVARMYTTVTEPGETNGESVIATVYSDPITFETLNPDSLENPATLMVRDIEGNDYPVVEINGIHWFKTNLRTSQFRDGTPLVKTTAENASEWFTGSASKWVSLDFDSTKDATYGKLYNGFAVRSWRGICPAGWMVPSREDFAELRDSIGAYQMAGGPLKATGTLEAGTGLWKAPNTGATDSLGLSVIPAGVYKGSSTFERKTELAQLWSTTAVTGSQYNVSFYNSNATFWLSYDEERYGMSVRCMRSEAIDFPETATVVTTEPSTLTQTLAVLTGSAIPDGDGELSEWGIVLATHSTPTIQDVKLDANDPIHFIMDGNRSPEPDSTGAYASSPDNFKILATGLSAGTEYHARAYAEIDGNISYGNTVNFRTISSSTDPVVDIDGNAYATVLIGEQVWMAENLRVSRFNDSSQIANLAELSVPLTQRAPAWLAYDNNDDYERVYGKLYNWAVLEGEQNICPDGWRVPTRFDWLTLIETINQQSGRRSTVYPSTASKLRVMGDDFWVESSNTNESGFSLLPSGVWDSSFENVSEGFSGAHDTPTSEQAFAQLWTGFRYIQLRSNNSGSFITNPSISSLYASYTLLEPSEPGFPYDEYSLDQIATSARAIRCLKGDRQLEPHTYGLSAPHVGSTFANVQGAVGEGETALYAARIRILEEGVEKIIRTDNIWRNLETLLKNTGSRFFNDALLSLKPDTPYEVEIQVRYYTQAGELTDWISKGESVLFTTEISNTDPVEDIDGNIYSTVQIADRMWMAENLRVSSFRNGQDLYDHTNQRWLNDWGSFYKNYSSHGANASAEEVLSKALKSKFYNHQAINNPIGLCPDGWSIPTKEEWLTLIDELGGMDQAGSRMAGLESESGFNVLSNGYIGYESFYSSNIFGGSSWTSVLKNIATDHAYFWSSTSDSIQTGAGWKTNVPWLLSMNTSDNNRIFGKNLTSTPQRPIGASVRCIKDNVILAPVPEPVEVSDISQTRVTLQAALRYDGGGTLSEWGIYLSLDPEPGPEDRVLKAEVPQLNSADQAKQSFQITADSLDSAPSFQIAVDSLIPGAAYFARAFAENEVGTGLGDIVRFRTLTDTTGVTIIDIDGNIYRTVQIGDQLWMKDNLRTTRYRNGDSIMHVPDSAEWDALTFLDEEQTIGEGAWSHYRNDSENEIPFGKLYNWYAVSHPSGLCPAGWIAPSKEDWDILSAYVGGNEVAGGALKAKGTLEAGTGLWLQPNEGATDSVGFSALPADFRYDDGDFSSTKGENAVFWSSTMENEYYAYSVSMNRYFSYLDIPSIQYGFGGSVRCLQDERSAPPLPDQPDTVQTDVAYQTPVDSQQGASAKVESHVDTTSVLSVQLPPATTQQTQDGDGRPRVVDVLEITPLTEQSVQDQMGLNDQEEQTEEQTELLEYLSYRKSDIYDVRLYDDQGSHIEEPRFENPATICIQSPSSLDELIGGWSNVGFIRIETGPNGEYVLIPDPAYTSSDSEDTACMETNGFSLFALVPMDLTKVKEAPIKQSKGRAPGIELPSGTYTDSLFIVLSGVPTATIRYTVDGTIPTDMSDMYIEPVILRDAGTVILNAKAFYESYAPSELISATYTLRIQNLEVPAARFPENGIGDVGVLTEFEWSSVSGADTYTLEIWEQLLFSEPLRFDGLTGSGITLTEPLKANTAYAWRVRAENSVGGSDWSAISTFATGIRTSSEMLNGLELPDKVTLHQNYPNPFNPSTTIRFGLPVTTQVKLEIYNLLGQRVSTLSNNRLNAGWHQLTFDGSHLSSGVYVYRLSTAEGEAQIRMFTLIK